MARSLNCVHLIGNLTRDPELRYTGSGRPVCDIGLATNRQWKSESGEKKEDTEYHKIVLWGKLAEIASEYLRKGMKAYFQGRIATRSYTAKDGTEKYATEIIAEDMLMLSGDPSYQKPKDTSATAAGDRNVGTTTPQKGKFQQTDETFHDKNQAEPEETNDQPDHEPVNVDPDEIPF